MQHKKNVDAIVYDCLLAKDAEAFSGGNIPMDGLSTQHRKEHKALVKGNKKIFVREGPVVFVRIAWESLYLMMGKLFASL